jgi:hypothetical protein
MCQWLVVRNYQSRECPRLRSWLKAELDEAFLKSRCIRIGASHPHSSLATDLQHEHRAVPLNQTQISRVKEKQH